MGAVKKGLRVIEGEASTTGDDWERALIRGGRGAIINNLANVARILRCSPEWSGIFTFNEATRDVELAHGGPCLRGTFPRAWQAGDEQTVAIWFQESRWRLDVSGTGVLDAALAVARERSYNPIRQHLEALPAWDGVKRLDSWLVTYGGAADSPYVRAVGAAWLRSVIARGLKPGAKCDAALVLEGSQGRFKSTAFAVLGGPFYIEIQTVVGDRAVQNMMGKLIAEMSELEALSRHDALATKQSVTIQSDRLRLPYDRRSVDVPRTAILCGTTNRRDWNKDETGGRRYWPVWVEGFNIPALRRDRDQLLAEALAEVKAGVPWHLTDKTIVEAAAEAVEERRQADAWEDVVGEYLAGKSSASMGDILEDALGLEKGRWGRSEQMRAAGILTALRWSRRRVRVGKELVWRYTPPPTEAPPVPNGQGGREQGWEQERQPKGAGVPNVPNLPTFSGGNADGFNEAPASSLILKEVGNVGNVGNNLEEKALEVCSQPVPNLERSGTWQRIYQEALASGQPEAGARAIADFEAGGADG